MSREKEERKKRKGEMRLTTEMKIANEYEIGLLLYLPYSIIPVCEPRAGLGATRKLEREKSAFS